MFQSILIFIWLCAIRVTALELETLKFLFSESMNRTVFNWIIAFAFLWAMSVTLSPRFKAFFAKYSIATLALKGILDDHCADATWKEVSSFSLLPISLNHVTKVESILVSNFFLVFFQSIFETIWVLLLECLDFLSVEYLFGFSFIRVLINLWINLLALLNWFWNVLASVESLLCYSSEPLWQTTLGHVLSLNIFFIVTTE